MDYSGYAIISFTVFRDDKGVVLSISGTSYHKDGSYLSAPEGETVIQSIELNGQPWQDQLTLGEENKALDQLDEAVRLNFRFFGDPD